MQDAPPAIVAPAPENVGTGESGQGPSLGAPQTGTCPLAAPDEIVVCAPSDTEVYRLSPIPPLPTERTATEKVIDALTVRLGPLVIAPGGACNSFPICISLAPPSGAPVEILHLVCLGPRSAARLDASAGSIAAETVNTIGRRELPFDDQINIELVQGRSGRIRLPRAMLPAYRNWTSGWFKLSEIQMTPEEITARAMIKGSDGPKVRINRAQGEISIDGNFGDYAGACTPFDPVA